MNYRGWFDYLCCSKVSTDEEDEEDPTETPEMKLTRVLAMPDKIPQKPQLLNDIGNTFLSRFRSTRAESDINNSVLALELAVNLLPATDTRLASFLGKYGKAVFKRYRLKGMVADIDEAISAERKAVHLTSKEHTKFPARLHNLGDSLHNRFDHVGELADISEAISLQKKSIQFTPEGHPSLPVRLNNLGLSLQAHFKRTGELGDISEAISLYQKSIQLTPKGHAYLHIRLDNLAYSLVTRFERTGELADISEAISLRQKCIQLTPEGHADLPASLNNLGISLQIRFRRTGELADISEAISLLQKSIQLTPEGHANLPICLDNLGYSLVTRFRRTGELAELSEAISLQQKSIQLTPEGHANLPVYLNNLGTSLQTRFKRTGELSDISEAISLQQKSIQLTPEGHANLPIWLYNLGYSLVTCFERTGELADLSEAISLQQKSIQLTPEGHANLPVYLNNLGDSLQTRFHHTSDAIDVQCAILHHRLSATSVSGPPSTRLLAAKSWICLAAKVDQSHILEAYHTTIRLLSQVAGLEQTIQTRYTNLINISELSSSASAAAIEFGQLSLALDWLEQGRCLVWSQLNDLRTPIDDLHIHCPTLADDIVRVSKALEKSGIRTEPVPYTEQTSMMAKISIQDEVHNHIKLAQEWDQLLIKVRATPQFKDFLRPLSCSTLLKTIPSSGYVVVINIHKDRSDALVLTSGASEPLHIALPEFPYEKADNLRHQLKSLLLDSRIRIRGFELDDSRGSRRYVPGIADILRQLWMFVVKPILDGIGYSMPAAIIPRIWWCVTGPLAFLPLHAAGIYTSANSTPGTYTTLSDFAVSSYTPTVRSLIRAKRKSRAIGPEQKGLLAISQPDTPGQCRIPGTTAEVMAIQRLLTNQKVEHLHLESGDATVGRVKEQMDAYSCIHFACHAAQNTTKPLQSGFYLYDGRLELSEIIKKYLLGADLAFLSACQTSTGDEKLSEEAVHLAGGMLAAGYRGVVATMWSIKDSYGPIIAEEFYKKLLSHGAEDGTDSGRLSGDGAAYALHYATQQARKTLGTSESSLLTWVPYVHFGV